MKRPQTTSYVNAQGAYDNQEAPEFYEDDNTDEEEIDFSPLFDAVGGDENLVKLLKETYKDTHNLTVENIEEYLLYSSSQNHCEDGDVKKYITNTLIDIGAEETEQELIDRAWSD